MGDGWGEKREERKRDLDVGQGRRRGVSALGTTLKKKASMPIAASTSRLEALRRLASTPPRDLPRAGTASGERPLQSLAAELRASGAASDSTGAVGAGFGRGDDADVAALGTVFDAAVDAGLGCLVLDYVAEVCEDPLLTSR